MRAAIVAPSLVMFQVFGCSHWCRRPPHRNRDHSFSHLADVFRHLDSVDTVRYYLDCVHVGDRRGREVAYSTPISIRRVVVASRVHPTMSAVCVCIRHGNYRAGLSILFSVRSL